MLERGKMDRDAIEIVGIDSLVPKEHLLRKVDEAVDFNRLYEMVEPLYSEDTGRPSIDPVVLFKMCLSNICTDSPHYEEPQKKYGEASIIDGFWDIPCRKKRPIFPP